MSQRVGRRQDVVFFVDPGRVFVPREIDDQIARQIGPFANPTNRRAEMLQLALSIARTITVAIV